MSAAWRMRALCTAGRIILENGGETYRAEDTVQYMGRALGLSEVEAFAIPSGLFLSYTDENGERCTSVTRVRLRGMHLARVDAVNHISRRLAQGQLAPEDLLQELQEAQHIGNTLPWFYAPLAAFVTAAGFAVMFGGGIVDMLVGGLSAALTQLTPMALRRQESSMLSILVGGVLAAFIPLAFHGLTGIGVPDAMIAAAIMPLVPGLSMTNAVQDLLRGDMVAGVAHGARALLIAAMVAGGVLIGTHVSGLLGLAAPVAQAQPLPVWAQAAVLFVSSLVAGMGFGALLYGPRAAILYGGVLGSVAYVGYWLLQLGGVSELVAMFAGALLGAVVAQLCARRVKMIATVFVTVAIMPLVPGLGLYRAMRALAMGEGLNGLTIAAYTMALILMLALGIGLGSMLARPRAREARRDG